MSNHITTIVITGGPCAGKTSGMNHLTKKLEERGYLVIVVPEKATQLAQSGITQAQTTSNYDFQEGLLLAQIAQEQSFLFFASKIQKKVVVLFDRGALDNKAYIEKTAWNEILRTNNMNEVALRDSRYDGVIHLRSAAVDREEMYTTSNNSARKETIEEARLLDEATLSSWVGHPHLFIVGNQGDFESKMDRVFRVALHIIGDPEPVEIERKFLITLPFSLKQIPVHCEVFNIEQVYVGGTRFRKRNHGTTSLYTKTIKERSGNPMTCIEKEDTVTEEDYVDAIKKKHGKMIKKRRAVFVYKDQYFELDFFENGLIILEIELLHINQEVTLPPWLPIEKEVTGVSAYSNIVLSRT